VRRTTSLLGNCRTRRDGKSGEKKRNNTNQLTFSISLPHFFFDRSASLQATPHTGNIREMGHTHGEIETLAAAAAQEV
jgi:hypothetical protein